MALVSNRKMIYERQLNQLISTQQLLGMETSDIQEEIRRLKEQIEYEDRKMAKYAQELARRKHNYMPFIFNLLKILGEESQLTPMFDKAKERASKRGHKRMKT